MLWVKVTLAVYNRCMNKKEYHTTCTPREEIVNTLTHFPGIIFGFLALGALTYKFLENGVVGHLLSYITYSISFILLFSASTIYHHVENGTKKLLFRKIDHSCIYIFMAGCYTPFIVINMASEHKYYFLILVWAIALLGVIQKFKMKFNNAILTVIPYLVFAYLCLLAKKQLIDVLPDLSFKLLLAGGIAYTTGVLFYVSKKIPYGHSIWHLFVLLGAVLHFGAIYTSI